MVMTYDYDRHARRTAADVFYERLPEGLREVRRELETVKQAHALSKSLVQSVRAMEQAGTELGREQPRLVRDLQKHLGGLLPVGKGQHVKKIETALAEVRRLEGALHSQPWQAVVSRSGAFGAILRALSEVTLGARTWIMKNRPKPEVAAFIAWYEKDLLGHLKEIEKAQKDAAPATKTATAIHGLIKYLEVGTGLMQTQMSRLMAPEVKKGISQWNDLHADVKLTSQYFEVTHDNFFDEATKLESKLGQWVDAGHRLVKALEKAVLESP